MFQLAWLILFYESDHQNILFLLCDFYNTPKMVIGVRTLFQTIFDVFFLMFIGPCIIMIVEE